ARIQARCVLPQFVQNLLHLKRGGDRLDQGGRLHASRGDPDPFLGEAEHVGPQAGLEMTLHLREVEVGARPPGEELLRVVEEVQSEIHEAARSDLAVDPQMLLGEMPSAGPHHQSRGLAVQSVLLPLRAAEFERAPDGPEEVEGLRRKERIVLPGAGRSDLDPPDRRFVHPVVARSRRSRLERISLAYRTGGTSLPPDGSKRPAIAGPTSLATPTILGPCRPWSQNLLPSREMSRRPMESRGARP